MTQTLSPGGSAEPRPLAALDFMGVVTNVHSQKNRHGRYNANRLGSILGNHGMVRESSSLDELPDVVHEFRQRQVKVVGVNGGDGTFSAVLNEWLRQAGPKELPVFLPLRGGTMNVIANELNLRGNPANLTRRFVDTLMGRIHPPGLHWFKTIEVRVSGDPEPRYGFVWSMGLSYNIVQEYYSNTSATPMSALMLVLASIAGLPPPMRRMPLLQRLWRPLLGQVTVDGEKFSSDKINIAVAGTINKFVLWFAPFDKGVGGKDDGFGFLLNAMPWTEVMKKIWPLSRGRLHTDRHWNQLTRHVQIVSRCGFVMDGEPYDPKGEVQIDLREGPPITVLMPGTRPGPYAFA